MVVPKKAMVALSNVAPAANMAAQHFMLCLLLLAPSAFGFSIRGAPAYDAAENEAALATHAAQTGVNEMEDTSKLVNSEQKKMSKYLQKKSAGLVPASLSADDGSTNYLIASFPELRVVNYVRLPDLVWRPLVATGLASPHSVVIDEDRARVYIADKGVAKIVWYQLISLPGGTLISDGRQHVAAQGVSVRNMALDLSGNLWFSGTTTPLPPIPAVDGIFKQTLLTIDQSTASGVPLPPLAQWTSVATKSVASPLALDAFSIYYGNDMAGTSKGSIVKASQTVPTDPSTGISPMADNIDTTYSVAVTPTAIFYGGDNTIYGVLKSKVGGSCGATGAQCKVVTDLVKKPTAMLWDGDGSVFVADNGAGAIYSFASGSVSPHALDKIIDAGQVWGLDVFKVSKGSARGMAAPLALVVLLSALIATFQ